MSGCRRLCFSPPLVMGDKPSGGVHQQLVFCVFFFFYVVQGSPGRPIGLYSGLFESVIEMLILLSLPLLSLLMFPLPLLLFHLHLSERPLQQQVPRSWILRLRTKQLFCCSQTLALFPRWPFCQRERRGSPLTGLGLGLGFWGRR